MKSSVSRDLRSHVPQMWGSLSSSSLLYVPWPGLCGGGGGVVGREEGVSAVDHPGFGSSVVVGGGEGVVSVVHEGHVRGGGWLPVVGLGTLPGTWSLKLLSEVTQSTDVLLSHAMVSVGVVLGGGWAMLGS